MSAPTANVGAEKGIFDSRFSFLFPFAGNIPVFVRCGDGAGTYFSNGRREFPRRGTLTCRRKKIAVVSELLRNFALLNSISTRFQLNSISNQFNLKSTLNERCGSRKRTLKKEYSTSTDQRCFHKHFEHTVSSICFLVVAFYPMAW